MTKGAEASRKLWLDRRASIQLIDFLTVIAKEVMVVHFSGKLITGRFGRKLDCNQPALVDHRLEVAIDGCNAEIVNTALCVGENLVRREGTVGLDKGRANRVLLACISRCDSALRFHV